MNIICNNCIGGFIYRDFLKSPYQNPFIWNVFYYDNFVKLAENYDSTDFTNLTNAKLKKCESLPQYTVPELTIDNKFKIEYIHNIYKPGCKTLTKNYIWNYSEDILSYSVDKYNERVKRMGNQKTILLYYDAPDHFVTMDCMKKFLQVKSPQDKYVLTKYQDHYEQMMKWDCDPQHIIKVEVSNKLEVVPEQISKRINFHDQG